MYNNVTNFGIKRNAEDLLKRLKPFSVAVDKIQEKNYTKTAAVHVWEELEKKHMEENLDKICMKSISSLNNHALDSLHFI